MDCCTAKRLVADARFEPKPGPISERVMKCSGCGALWVEEWSVRVGYPPLEDHDIFDYRRVTEDQARARFPAS